MKFLRISLTAIIGVLLAQGVAHAQNASELLEQSERTRSLTTAERQSYESKSVPQLYEGEVEDLGPQLLLLEKMKRKLFEAFVDFQVYRTNNATLAEPHTSTDVFVSTTQIAYLFKPRKFSDGDVNTRLGLRYQTFFYGMIGNDNAPLNPGGAPVDTLDFISRSAFADAAWTRGMWRVTAGLTYTSLISAHANQGNFYYEWVPAWSVGRMQQINDNWTAFYMYDGAYHISTTVSQRPAGDDDIDRKVDNALTAMFTRQLGNGWSFQPSVRLQVSDYVSSTRHRTDYIGSLAGTLQYKFSEQVSGRFFSSYDARESDDPTAADYRNNNFGLGLSGYLKF